MKNNNIDKSIQNEINSFKDLVLHLESFLFKGNDGLKNLSNIIKILLKFQLFI